MDQSLFHIMTAGPGALPWVVFLARLAASWVVPGLALGLFVAFQMRRSRAALLDAVAAGLVGLGLVQVIGALWYRPRPFEVGQGLNLLNHLPENSFPSDHATLVFAVAFALILARLRVGWLVLVLGGLTGWARVYLGAHWPGDILGGVPLGLASSLVLRRASFRLRVWAWADSMSDKIIAALIRRLGKG